MNIWPVSREDMPMRVAKKEIAGTLRDMEEKHGLREGVLTRVYEEESRVVFMGVRRNVLKNIRRIVHDYAPSKEEVE